MSEPSEEQITRPAPEPAFTVRSVAASIFSMLLVAMLVHVIGAVQGWNKEVGEHALPYPAVAVFLALLGVCALAWSGLKFRLLGRGELLVVWVCVLISAPVAGFGFWRAMTSTVMTLPYFEYFEQLEALDEKLWPHGPDLFRNVEPAVSGSGAEILAGDDRTVRLRVGERDGVAALTYTLPVGGPEAGGLEHGRPYMVTFRVRAERLASSANLFLRVFADEAAEPSALPVITRKLANRTFLQPKGFSRVGAYGLTIPSEARESVRFEFGLEGAGEAVVAEPRLMDVGALVYSFSGYRTLPRAEWESLDPSRRAGVLPRPDSWVSPAGLKFLLWDVIPWRDWAGPILSWGSYVLLWYLAVLALMLVYRRQWMENERFSMPLGQVPQYLLGIGETPQANGPGWPLGAIWGSRWFWGGAVFALLWCLLIGWRQFNPSIADVTFQTELKSYITDPAWKEVWNDTVFKILPLTVAIALLMELNVLLSLVAGYVLFRVQPWVSGKFGLKGTETGFPDAQDELLSGILTYGLLIFLLTWKYWGGYLRRAFRGGNEHAEPLAPRLVLALLVFALAGQWVWSSLHGMNPLGMLGVFFCMVLAGLVAAKIRTEIGVPGSGYVSTYQNMTPWWKMLPFLGGMTLLSAEGSMFLVLVSVLVGASIMHLPGIQLEGIELGRRLGVRRRHMVYAGLFGLVGAILLGGWVYLSTSYLVGIDTYEVTEHFAGKRYFITFFDADLRQATAGGDPGGLRWLAAAVAAALTAIAVVIRLIFPGFGLHPLGVVLGPSELLNAAWGSLLLAWAIRSAVLRFGGAASVREKLRPIAIGMIVGVMLAYFIFTIVNGIILGGSSEADRIQMLF